MRSHSIVILSMLTILFTDRSIAQIHTGVYSLKGSMTYSSGTQEIANDRMEYSTLSVTPGFTYFILDNVELNWALQYVDMRSSGRYLSASQSSTTVLAGARFYLPMEEMALFGGAGIGLTDGMNRMNYLYEGGVDIFITPALALEPTAMYTQEYFEYYSTSGIRVGIGVRYFIQ